MSKDTYMIISKQVREQLEEDSKIAAEKRKMTVKCKCGRRVSFSVFNKMGWGVCSFCGCRVEKPRDAFKNKLMGLINEGKEK